MAIERTLGRVAYWFSLPLLLLLVYWPGINGWFQADDFAWLSLDRQIHDWPSFRHILFSPMAQGTIRPLSERAFFVLSHHWFGADALPMHLCIYLGACGAAILLAWITRRLTGSTMAGWFAGAIWCVSCGLAVCITWVSCSNEIFCVFFLLAAFALRLRRLYGAEVVVFLVGFGILEINIVYPALALAGALITGDRENRKRDLLQLLPLFVISVIYFFIHSHFAPAQTSGPYAMHFDRSIAVSAVRYWKWALVSPDGYSFMAGVLSLGIAFVAWFERRTVLFGLAWFAITIAPLLPLRDHVSDYYLTIPAAGLALALAAGISSPRIPVRGIAFALACLFLVGNTPAAHARTAWWADASERVRTLVLGVVTAHDKHPGKAILLDGIDTGLFSISVADSAFNVFGITDVYLTPGSLDSIHAASHLSPVSKFALPEGPTLRALAQNRAIVYRIDGDRLRNVTTSYSDFASTHFENKSPQRVDVANPLMGYLLGPGWYEAAGGARWMPLQASLRLGGPLNGQNHLILSGWRPEEAVRSGPLQLEVAIDGELLPPSTISNPEPQFIRMFDMPASARGKQSIVVRIRVSRTFHAPGDSRDLGLAFGVVEVAP